MTVVRDLPTEKIIGNKRIITSQTVIVSDSYYVTKGENFVIVKQVDECKVKIDSKTTSHVTIKALTDVLIIPDIGKIDEEYDEVSIGKGACVELIFSLGNWYIVSSDGLKLD